VRNITAQRNITTQPNVVPRQAPLAIESTATAVVAVAADDTETHGPAMVAALAELATRQELVIVYGYLKPPDGSLPPHRLITALRAELPRQVIVAVLLEAASPVAAPERELLADLLNDGTIAITVVDIPDPTPFARTIAHSLDADLALRLTPGQPELPRFEPLGPPDSTARPTRQP
jgi:hypothetical protein